MTVALDLGPTTEARFTAAFGASATITAKAAAELLGLDVKTLGALTDRLIIRAVRRGKLRSYTERDLRAYLTEGPGAGERQWESINRRKAGSGTTSFNSKVVAFTARPVSKASAKPRR